MYDPNSASDMRRMFAEYDFINQNDTDFMKPKYIDDWEEFATVENNEMVLRSEAISSLDVAKGIIVKSNEDYELAGNARKEIKNTLKNIKAYWEPKKIRRTSCTNRLYPLKKK